MSPQARAPMNAMSTTLDSIPLDSKAEDDQLEHKDVALEEQALGPPSYTEAESKTVRFRMDVFMLPLLCFMNVCSYLDKANIGVANTAGMSADLGLSTQQYQALLTIFYVVYTLFQWEFIMLKYIQPKLWLGSIVLLWGLTSALQGVTQGFAGMMVCRVVIAALEAGGGPAISFYFTMLYPRGEFGFRWAIFQASSCVSNAMAGAMAYGLVQLKTSLTPWRLVYVVESSPTFLCGILIFLFIPNGPDKCIFLNGRQKEIALERVQRGVIVEKHGFTWRHMLQGFKEPWTWWIGLIHFFGGAAFNSLPVFITAIIKDMGYTSINAQGLSAPPYIIAFFIAIGCAYFSDRYSVRGWWIAAGQGIGGIGYMVIAFAPSIGARYFAVYITVIGMYIAQPLMFSWCATNAESDSKRAATLITFLVMGQLGSILGSNVYDDPPRYIKGNSICAAGLFANIILAITGTYYLKWRNRQKDEKYGKHDPTVRLQQSVDGGDNPNFRFVM